MTACLNKGRHEALNQLNLTSGIRQKECHWKNTVLSHQARFFAVLNV
jgi:hypothetical protein